MHLQLLAVCVITLAAPAGFAGDLYVNPQVGNDANSGQNKTATGKDGPFKTIQRAIDVCKPGDTIHLVKTNDVYHQNIEIRDGLSGTREQPIIIDGHGATLSGLTKLRPEDWKAVGNGLYRHDHLLPEFPHQKPVNQALLWRFFFVFDGQMNRMGKSGKSEHPPMPKPPDLKPGEWTYDEEEMAFFVKIDPSTKLANARIEYPDLINGLKTSDGQSEHFIIRNLTVTHFTNDGFNINGATKHYRFENVQAIECGDDGISAHTDSEIEMDGFVSRGNSTGFCHIQGASSVTRRADLRNNHAFDVLLTGWGKHELYECLILPNHGQIRTVRVTSEGADAGKRCSLQLEKVLIDRDQDQADAKTSEARDPKAQPIIELLGACDLTISMSKISSINLQSRWPGGGAGKVSVFDSVLAGKRPPTIDLLPDTKWSADRNIYSLKSLSISGQRYEFAQWEAYRIASGQDGNSKWAEVSPDAAPASR